MKNQETRKWNREKLYKKINKNNALQHAIQNWGDKIKRAWKKITQTENWYKIEKKENWKAF